jgi:hypothetical protein
MSEDDEFEAYRHHLLLAEQRAQEDYDKTVVSLSGGALGVSFAFLDNIVKGRPLTNPNLLFVAWACWSISLLVVLASFFFSIRALRKAQKQARTGAIFLRTPGGWAAKLTEIANVTGAVLFVVGLLFIGVFVWRNLTAIAP